MEESRGGGAWKDWKHQLDELRGGKKDVQRLRLHFQQRHFAFPFAAFCLVLFAAGGWAPAHFCSFSSFGPTDGEGRRAPALARPPPRPGRSAHLPPPPLPAALRPPPRSPAGRRCGARTGGDPLAPQSPPVPPAGLVVGACGEGLGESGCVEERNRKRPTARAERKGGRTPGMGVWGGAPENRPSEGGWGPSPHSAPGRAACLAPPPAPGGGDGAASFARSRRGCVPSQPRARLPNAAPGPGRQASPSCRKNGQGRARLGAPVGPGGKDGTMPASGRPAGRRHRTPVCGVQVPGIFRCGRCLEASLGLSSGATGGSSGNKVRLSHPRPPNC